jgi:hypothetical protein
MENNKRYGWHCRDFSHWYKYENFEGKIVEVTIISETKNDPYEGRCENLEYLGEVKKYISSGGEKQYREYPRQTMNRNK